MLEIDHVFAFVEPPGDWPHVLENAGFRLDSGTRHEGQGTRNRRLLLERSYIEWIWLENRAEAEANPMRLDRRADWRTTGFNSFGIVLRGSLNAVGREAFEQYVPPYPMPVTMWIA